jgi:MscS family membrane protein
MNSLNQYIDQMSASHPAVQVLIFLAAVIILWIIGRVTKYLLRRASRRVLATDKPVYATILNAISKSVTFILITLGIALLAHLLPLAEKSGAIVLTVSSVLVTLSFGMLFFYLVDAPGEWFEQLMIRQDNSTSRMFAPAIRKTLRVIVVILVVVQLFQLLSDKPLTSVIAGLGIGGLAVALAAQDTIKHFIGSFVLAADKPFEIGDRVVIDGHDGPVESIGMRSTRIRTLEGHLVSIPNGELANRTIRNIGKRPFIRRIGNITVTYDTPPHKLQQAIGILKEILENHEGMKADLPPRVYFNELNSASLNILFLYWYHPPDYWTYMSYSEKVNLEIMRRFNAEGIDFAFPTQTLYLAGDDKRPLNIGIDNRNQPGSHDIPS